MGWASSETPMGENERYIRLYDHENHVAYIARYCTLCNAWMDKTGGSNFGVSGEWFCRLHVEADQ